MLRLNGSFDTASRCCYSKTVRGRVRSACGRHSKARQSHNTFSASGEDYICDWVAFCAPPAGKLEVSGGAGVRGRLRLCSLSLVFDPDEQRLPILKFPFAKVDSCDKDDAVDGALCVTCTQWVRMKSAGVDAPYVTDKSGPASWRFSLAFAKLSALLGPAKQQLAICRMPHFERLVALKEAARAREEAATFDVSRLSDLSDRPLLSLPAAQVTLLLREPGRLVVTRGRVYFQPLHNLNADTPVRSRPLSAVAAVARRRHQLRHVALEVFFMEPDARAAGGWEVRHSEAHVRCMTDSLLPPRPRHAVTGCQHFPDVPHASSSG